MGKSFQFNNSDPAASIIAILDSGNYDNLPLWLKSMESVSDDMVDTVASSLEKVHAQIVSKLTTANGTVQRSNLPIYQWLFEWDGSGSRSRVAYVQNFVPALVWTYLLLKKRGEDSSGVETCLVGMYNNRVSRQGGSGTNIRDLRFPSVYHLPTSRRGSSEGTKAQSEKAPQATVGSLVASNRGEVLGFILDEFLSCLSSVTLYSRFNFMELAVRLSCAPSQPWQPKKKLLGEKRSPTERLAAFNIEGSESPFISAPKEITERMLTGLNWCFYRTELCEAAELSIQAYKDRLGDDFDPALGLHAEALYKSTRVALLSN